MRVLGSRARSPEVAETLGPEPWPRACARAGAHLGVWLLTLLGLWLAAAPLRALDVPALQGPVNDYAGMLTPDEQRALESKLRTHQEATGHELTLLTVPSLEDDEITEFSIRVAEKWKLGSEKEDNGLIVVIARDDRKMRIEVGHGLEGEITDAFSASVIREVLQPAFRQSDYAGGLNRAFDLLMAKGQGIAIDPPKPSRSQHRESVGPLFIFGVVLVIMILSSLSGGGRGGRRRRRGGFYVFPMGGGWGGGGGGWGGGGGGGWGGGGGSFGGGGASGDW